MGSPRRVPSESKIHDDTMREKLLGDHNHDILFVYESVDIVNNDTE